MLAFICVYVCALDVGLVISLSSDIVVIDHSLLYFLFLRAFPLFI